jgi:hypothetical protein
LDEDLLSVDTNGLTKEGDDATVIPAANFLLNPVNLGPPFSRIEIKLSTTAFFSSKDTHQEQIRVAALWGFSDDTKAAGTVASGLASSSTVTTFVCSDASLIDVGDTLLIGSEQVFVSERSTNDVGTNTNGALTVNKAETTVPVVSGAAIKVGEVILVEAERMYVESITGNDLTVKRAYDGSTLAAHDTGKDISVFRTLTIVRATNGTTAATHANSTAINKYAPPADIVAMCKALAIHADKAEQGGWTGSHGSGEGAVRVSQREIDDKRDRVKRIYGRRVVGAV